MPVSKPDYSSGASTTTNLDVGTYSITQVAEGLSIPKYDHVFLSNYTAGGNPQLIVYRSGGSSGVIVAQLALTYDGSGNLTSVART